MPFSNHPMLLVLAVALVGVLHTMVPDHWAPIALLARQHGWSQTRTARTAALAGVGHTLSTLVIAIAVWGAGAVLAARSLHSAGGLPWGVGANCASIITAIRIWGTRTFTGMRTDSSTGIGTNITMKIGTRLKETWPSSRFTITRTKRPLERHCC